MDKNLTQRYDLISFYCLKSQQNKLVLALQNVMENLFIKTKRKRRDAQKSGEIKSKKNKNKIPVQRRNMRA